MILCANCHREFHYLQKQKKIDTLDDYIKSSI
jgi:predicted HNH restriction endonuclease